MLQGAFPDIKRLLLKHARHIGTHDERYTTYLRYITKVEYACLNYWRAVDEHERCKSNGH